MSEQDRVKWDARYREGAYADRTQPSAWLASCLQPDSHSGQHDRRRSGQQSRRPRALDLACGLGRNARFLAGLGYEVDAVDISAQALETAHALSMESDPETAGSIHWIEQDLDRELLSELSDYDLIIVMRYLDLSLLPALAGRLRPGGELYCEVHLQHEAPDLAGPGSERFRAAPGALRSAVAESLRIEDYEEGLFHDPDGRKVALARLLAVA